MSGRRFNRISTQRGLVLVTSLLLLVVVTILAIGMFRSYGLGEQIAGNVRDKQRALNAAETAEQYAESWLSSGNATGAVACAGPPVDYTAGPQVCTLSLQGQAIDPASLPWTVGGNQVGVNYLAPGPTLMPLSTSQTSGGSNTYSQKPRFYIGFLSTGVANGLITNIYQIDAVAYGGTANTAAVVETTYQVQTATKNLGEGQ